MKSVKDSAGVGYVPVAEYQVLKQANGGGESGLTTAKFQTLGAGQAGFCTGTMGGCTCMVVKSDGARPQYYGQHGGGGAQVLNIDDLVTKLKHDGNQGPISVTFIPSNDNWESAHRGRIAEGPEDKMRSYLTHSSEREAIKNAEERLMREFDDRGVTVTTSPALQVVGIGHIGTDMDARAGVPGNPARLVNAMGSQEGMLMSLNDMSDDVPDVGHKSKNCCTIL